MAVLLGICNGNDNTLNKMYSAVQHRGKDAYNRHFIGQNGMATAQKSTDLVIRDSSGLHTANECIIGIAGAVTDSSNKRLKPEAILHLYQQNGLQKLLNDIRGAFVMAILDKDKLYLIRDATGQRTLYYHQGNAQFAFCIESKGIQQLESFSPTLNVKALFQYFSYSFVPMHDTMLQGIKELPAGCCLCYHLESKHLYIERYFKLEDIPKHPNPDYVYWISRIRRHVSDEIEDKLLGQDDVGVFLSGGLDSSIIAAQVAQRHHKPVHTFSIHFGKKYLNELDYAKMVADQYNTVHHEVAIRPKDFIPKLRQTIWQLDDPIGDPITVPNCELAQYASNYVPVIFNGEGSDPCFGGPKNIPMLLQHWYGGIQRPTNFREKAYLESYRRGYKHLKTLLAPHLVEQLDEEAYLESVLKPFFDEKKLNFLDKMMSINIRLKGAHLILPKVERMLGSAGLTAVAPFFTQQMVQSSIEMPSELKLHQGIEKYILKQAYQAEVPEAIIKRPKSGMRVPVRYWFEGEMKRYKHKILHPKAVKEAGIFNPDTIKLLLKYSNEKGLERHGLLTWMVMTFEIWRQLFIEKKAV